MQLLGDMVRSVPGGDPDADCCPGGFCRERCRNCRYRIDQARKIEEFAKTYGVTYPVLIAEAGAIELMRRLGNALGGLPYTVVVDRVGAVAHRRLGALTRAEVEGVLEGLLR